MIYHPLNCSDWGGNLKFKVAGKIYNSASYPLCPKRVMVTILVINRLQRSSSKWGGGGGGRRDFFDRDDDDDDFGGFGERYNSSSNPGLRSEIAIKIPASHSSDTSVFSPLIRKPESDFRFNFSRGRGGGGGGSSWRTSKDPYGADDDVGSSNWEKEFEVLKVQNKPAPKVSYTRIKVEIHSSFIWRMVNCDGLGNLKELDFYSDSCRLQPLNSKHTFHNSMPTMLNLRSPEGRMEQQL